jgi:hypothetical protein
MTRRTDGVLQWQSTTLFIGNVVFTGVALWGA